MGCCAVLGMFDGTRGYIDYFLGGESGWGWDVKNEVRLGVLPKWSYCNFGAGKTAFVLCHYFE